MKDFVLFLRAKVNTANMLLAVHASEDTIFSYSSKHRVDFECLRNLTSQKYDRNRMEECTFFILKMLSCTEIILESNGESFS